MVLDTIISSSLRRSQNVFCSPSFRKQYAKGDEMGSCYTLVQRHRFLLTALALLAFLCSVYLYFAITLGAGVDSCPGLTGAHWETCHLGQTMASAANGKLKIF